MGKGGIGGVVITQDEYFHGTERKDGVLGTAKVAATVQVKVHVVCVSPLALPGLTNEAFRDLLELRLPTAAATRPPEMRPSLSQNDFFPLLIPTRRSCSLTEIARHGSAIRVRSRCWLWMLLVVGRS